jgi:hypothetical protein
MLIMLTLAGFMPPDCSARLMAIGAASELILKASNCRKDERRCGCLSRSGLPGPARCALCLNNSPIERAQAERGRRPTFHGPHVPAGVCLVVKLAGMSQTALGDKVWERDDA